MKCQVRTRTKTKNEFEFPEKKKTPAEIYKVILLGWYFGKTAGLWGTYNNEPSDDFLSSTRVRLNESSLNTFGDSWVLDKKCKTSVTQIKSSRTPPQNILTLCEDFFASKVSQLNTCFQKIPKESFKTMCLNSQTEQEACMSAISYINLCSYANVPLRIPDTCVKSV